MNITRRTLLKGLAAMALSLDAGVELRAQAPDTDLTGSWHTTSALDPVILSVEPNGQALVFLMHGGSKNMAGTMWKPLPGGLLIDGLPRFRLWKGPHRGRVRVEMDFPDEFEVSENWRTFPRSFFMNRIEDTDLPPHLRDRPLLTLLGRGEKLGLK